MAVSHWRAYKHMGEQGQNSKEFSGAGGPNETIFSMERYKIGINIPLHKYKVGDSLQDSKKVLVILSDHKMNISSALLLLRVHSYRETNRHEYSLWNSLLSLLCIDGFLDWVLRLTVDCKFHKSHRLVTESWDKKKNNQMSREDILYIFSVCWQGCTLTPQLVVKERRKSIFWVSAR